MCFLTFHIVLLLLLSPTLVLGVRVRQPGSSPLWRFTSGLNRVALDDLRNSVLQPQLAAAQPQQHQQQHSVTSNPSAATNLLQTATSASAPLAARASFSTHALFNTLTEVASSSRLAPSTQPQQQQQQTTPNPDASKHQVAAEWQQRLAAGQDANLPVRTDIPAPGVHHRHVLTDDGDILPETQELQAPRPEGAPAFPPRREFLLPAHLYGALGSCLVYDVRAWVWYAWCHFRCLGHPYRVVRSGTCAFLHTHPHIFF